MVLILLVYWKLETLDIHSKILAIVILRYFVYLDVERLKNKVLLNYLI